MASFLGIPWTKSSLERNQESVELYPKQVDTSWFKSRTLPHKGPLQPPKVLAVLFSTFMSFCLLVCSVQGLRQPRVTWSLLCSQG